VVVGGDCSSHAVEFLLGGGDAEVDAFDLAGPAVGVSFVETGLEVVGVDLDEPCVLWGSGRRRGQRRQACSWMHAVA
jgi:hypothetical protein